MQDPAQQPASTYAPPGEQAEYVPPELVREGIEGPCLQWISIDEPQVPVDLGEEDYVLDTYFNPEFDTWEALVLVKPDQQEEEEEDEEE